MGDTTAAQAIANARAAILPLLDRVARLDPEGARDAASRLAVAEQAARDSAARKDSAPNRVKAIPIPHGGMIVPGISALATGAQSAPFPLTWPISGQAIGIAVSVKGAGISTQDQYMTAMLNLGLRVTLAGAVQGEIFSDGQGGNFMSFYSISTQNQPFFPISRRFSRNEVWQITLQNSVGGINPVTSVVQFLYLDDNVVG